jgi:MFS family permease
MSRLTNTRAFWLKGSILVSFLAASSVPSPLYSLYREAWGFSSLTLTVIFSSYALALLAALLVFGGLSDHRGRREVVLVSLALEIAATILFYEATSVGWLLAARVVQGLATGMMTGAIGAGLLDLNRERGAVVNSVAPMVGLGLGALVASLLVQFAPAPTQLVYAVLLVIFALQIIAAMYLPETAQRRAGAWRSLIPNLSIPAAARTTLARALPVNTAQWALGGFYLSLGPTLASTVTRLDGPLVGGVLIAVLMFSSAGAMAYVRSRATNLSQMAGAVALVIGVAATLAGILLTSAAAFVVGTAVAGAGFGAAFSGSMRSLVPLAAPHERAQLVSGFLVLSYAAFSIPAIAAGYLTAIFGLQATAIGYASAVGAMAIGALAVLRPKPVPLPT